MTQDKKAMIDKAQEVEALLINTPNSYGTYYMGYSIDSQDNMRQLSISVMHWAQGYVVIDFTHTVLEFDIQGEDSEFDRIIDLVQDHFNAEIKI